MKKTMGAWAAALCAGIAITGCSGAETSNDVAESPTMPHQSTTDPSQAPSSVTEKPGVGEKSPRGNYVAAIGSPVGAGNQQKDKADVRWTITTITVDPPCELSISKPAQNGHIIVATIEAETSERFDETLTLPGGFHPANNWSISGPDGYVQPRPTSDASTYCIDPEWPKELAPASKYRFRIAFDSKTPSGLLVYRAPNWKDGWEWPFG